MKNPITSPTQAGRGSRRAFPVRSPGFSRFLSLPILLSTLLLSSLTSPGQTTQSATLPAGIPGTTTTNLAAPWFFTVHGAPPNSAQSSPQPFGVFITQGAAVCANNTNTIYTFSPSLDGVSIMTNTTVTIAVTPQSTNAVKTYTYIPGTNFYGATAWALWSIQNLNTNTLFPSNVVVITAQ